MPPQTASQTLDEHLPDQPPAAGAQRLTHDEPRPSHAAAREHQVRDVGARHQQKNRRCAEEQRQNVLQAANEVRTERNDHRANSCSK